MIMNLKNIPDNLLFWEYAFTIIVSLYILFALNKRKIWMLPLPFLSLGVIVLLNIGIFNKITFLDSDLCFHKSLIDMLGNSEIFHNDKTMEVFYKTYTFGYHYLFYPFYRLGVSVELLSKILGIILSLFIPLIFYYLGLAIYARKDAAFICGLFAYIPSIWDTIYIGLPRSLGFAIFILTLAFLFKYWKKRSFLYLAAVYIGMLLTLIVHSFSFMILFIVIAVFMVSDLFSKFNIKKSSCLLTNLFLFCIIVFPLLAFVIIRQKELLDFTSRNWIKASGLLFFRVPYADIKPGDIFNNIGFLPVILFFYSALSFYTLRTENRSALAGSELHLSKKEEGDKQQILFLMSFSLLFILLAVLFFDKLFFLKAHRFFPFISALFYLAGLPKIERLYMLLKPNIIVTVIAIAFTIMPAMSYIDLRIKASINPYELHKIEEDGKLPLDPVQFSEIYEIASKIKTDILQKEIIACSLRFGDVLRMYAERGVTACWKTGGMSTTYKKTGVIFKEQIRNSDILYKDPLFLYNLYKARYFLFEKSKLKEREIILTGFSLLFETDNLAFYEYKCGDE